jgi:hypothetical protein
MKFFTCIILVALSIFIQFSCENKNKKSNEIIEKPAAEFDSSNKNTSLEQLKHFVERGLENWELSFKDFQIDSFRLVQETEFEQQDYDEVSDLAKFYELYKPSLSFSPDSSLFIDLFSSGLMLRKEGKKIIASADVDQAISLCNLSTKDWRRIVSFGPSAAIEEATWVSATQFILAGTMHNDDGEKMAIILTGDITSKKLRWFEAINIIRPSSSLYEASGITKLKIDEWD